MDESLVPLNPEETAEWGTKGKAAGVSAIASALEAGLEKAIAKPDYQREEIFSHLKSSTSSKGSRNGSSAKRNGRRRDDRKKNFCPANGMDDDRP